MSNSNDNNLEFILNEKNLYTILGINENVGSDEISQAYKSLAKINHPDKFIHLKGTQEFSNREAIFQKITNAYNILKDPEKKKQFDFDLRLKRIKQESGNKVNNIHIITSTQPGFIKSDVLNGFNFSQGESEREEARKKRQEKEKEDAFKVFDQAKKYIVQLKYDEAINLLRQLTDKFPKEAQFHSYFGLAMQRKGWYGYAQAEFKVALHYNSKDPIALEFYKKQEIESEDSSQKGIFRTLKSIFKKA